MADGFVLNAFMAFLVAAAIVFTDLKKQGACPKRRSPKSGLSKAEGKGKEGTRPPVLWFTLLLW